MSFYVGQLVECIDDRPEPNTEWKSPVRRGGRYIIRRLAIIDGSLCIATDIDPDWALYAWRFRPLVERKTDISFAHEILKKVTRKQTERA